MLAALVARRGPAVLAFCDAVCDPADVADAVAEAFARFRALVSALGDLGDADPDTYLLGATRHAAAAMARVPNDGRSMLRSLGRGAGSETYAAVPGLLAARADSMLGADDLERLSRLLEKSAASREVEAAFRRAERGYRSPPARPLSVDRTALVLSAMRAAAPIAPQFAQAPEPVGSAPAAAVDPAPAAPEPATEPDPAPAPAPAAVDVVPAEDPDEEPPAPLEPVGDVSGTDRTPAAEEDPGPLPAAAPRPSWRSLRGRRAAAPAAVPGAEGTAPDADPVDAEPGLGKAHVARSGEDEATGDHPAAEADEHGDPDEDGFGDDEPSGDEHTVIVPPGDAALASAPLGDDDALTSPTRVYRARRGLPGRGASGGVPLLPSGGKGINLPRHEPAAAGDAGAPAADHGPVYRLLLPAVAILVAILVMLAIAGVFGGGDPAPAATMAPVATQLPPGAAVRPATTTTAATTPRRPSRPARPRTVRKAAPKTSVTTTSTEPRSAAEAAVAAIAVPAAAARTGSTAPTRATPAPRRRTAPAGTPKPESSAAAVEKVVSSSALPGGTGTPPADDGYVPTPATTTPAAPTTP